MGAETMINERMNNPAARGASSEQCPLVHAAALYHAARKTVKHFPLRARHVTLRILRFTILFFQPLVLLSVHRVGVDLRRLLIFLGLNALVSAVVTLSVLWVWDLTHRNPTAGLTQGGTLTPAQAGASPPGASAGSGGTQTAGGASNATTGLATITPTVYVVQSGDTLGKIALEFDISVEELMVANGLTDPNVLEVGQTLTIPVGPISTPVPTDTPVSPETPISGDTPTSPPSSTLQAGTLAPLATSTPVPGGGGETQLAIRGVIGAGNPAEERVTIVNVGGDVSLAGWTLRDSQGNVFFFPALSLFQGGAVTVHTKTGANTVTDLYWNQTTAIWESGEQVVLADPAGVVHTTFVVP